MTNRTIFAPGLLCTLASPAFAEPLFRPEHAVQFVAFGLLLMFVVTATIVWAVVWWLKRRRGPGWY